MCLCLKGWVNRNDEPAVDRTHLDQIKVMTPERWAQLRVSFRDMANRTAGANSARAESREETRLILYPVLVSRAQTTFATVNLAAALHL